MDCFVVWQTFVCRARHRSNSWRLKPFGKLVLDDGMERGVAPDARKRDARGEVMRLHKLYSFALVESGPLRLIGIDFRAVVRHGHSFRRLAPF